MKKNNRRILREEWKDVEIGVDLIVKRIKKARLVRKIDSVYGVPRGGLVVAVLLSHKLNIPLILESAKIKKSTLIVDDISDSGETLAWHTREGKHLSAALIVLRDTEFWPTIYGVEHPANSWIVFPWETSKSSKKDNK